MAKTAWIEKTDIEHIEAKSPEHSACLMALGTCYLTIGEEF